AVDGVFLRMGQCVLNIFVAQMEVAALAEREPVSQLFPQTREARGIFFRTKTVFAVRVRCADNVRDAVPDGHLRHGEGSLDIGRAIVESIQQVMMNVDHAQDRIAGAAVPVRAATIDWKMRRPSAEPSNASLERSGCGIMPSTLRPSLRMPAMFASDPFGFAS